jgi:hypothetical protein
VLLISPVFTGLFSATIDQPIAITMLNCRAKLYPSKIER